MFRRVLFVASPIALTAVMAACSSSTPPPSGGVGGTGNVINVQAADFRFDPSTITTAAGKVTFHVKNAGANEYEFEIFRADQAVAEIEGLVPGLEKDLTVELPAGDYRIECRLPGHLEQGMKGTLTVTQ
jgi:uncharacterized cupredoxin-like copper-binding protein